MGPNPKSGKQREKKLPQLIGGPECEGQPKTVHHRTWDEESTYPAGPYDEFDVLIYQRIRRNEQTGELADFAVGLSVRPSGSADDWVQVLRVDVAHDFVHIDRYERAGLKTKTTDPVPESCLYDIDAARKWAWDDVWEIEEMMREWT